VSFDELEGLGLGRYGLGYEDFWNLTPKSFFNLQEYFEKRQNELQSAEWERVRWSTWILALPNSKKGTLKNPEDLIKFSWDKKEQVKRVCDLSKAEQKRVAHIFRKWQA
jgi:hypothetical protein